MVNDALPTNNTATTPGTPRTPRILNRIALYFYQLVKITLIEYSTSTLSVTSRPILRNIVKQFVTRQTNTCSVKKKFVTIKQSGFQNKPTHSFLTLTAVKVHVKIPPKVAMPAQTKMTISTAPSQEFVFPKNFAVMDTSTVSKEKMKNMMTAIRSILRMVSSQNTEH